MATKEELAHIIQKGFALIKEEQLYAQVDIIKKLRSLGYHATPASFNKIINGNLMGNKVLQILAEGIQQLIQLEMGYSYDIENKRFILSKKDTTWSPQIVPIQVEDKDTGAMKYYAAGRLTIQEKIAFMNQAQKEIIEVGVRLRTFTEYFTSRNEFEFKIPLQERLKKGVNIKLYLLDPDSNESRIYFEDREKVQEGEKKSPEITKTVIKQLEKINEEFKLYDYPGNLEVFLYKHIPYNHFLIIDGDTKLGQMMISHYMYGIRRADCPVIQFSKSIDRHLFRRYWNSYQLYTREAKKLI